MAQRISKMLVRTILEGSTVVMKVSVPEGRVGDLGFRA